MKFILAVDSPPMSLHMQITTWLQILAGIVSLVGTAIYIGVRIGKLEFTLDHRLKSIETIAKDIDQDVKQHEGVLSKHEAQLTGINVSIGHLEQIASRAEAGASGILR